MPGKITERGLLKHLFEKVFLDLEGTIVFGCLKFDDQDGFILEEVYSAGLHSRRVKPRHILKTGEVIYIYTFYGPKEARVAGKYPYLVELS